MFIVFELTEQANEVVRKPIGIYETEDLAREWIFKNFNEYKDVFRDGTEIIKYNENKTEIYISYVGGCQPVSFNAIYMILPYKINSEFDNISCFNSLFFEQFEIEFSEFKF
jgi:hypothetical protein